MQVEDRVQQYITRIRPTARANQKVWTEAQELIALVPERVDLQSIWLAGRTKPCYSNIKVEQGTALHNQIATHHEFSESAHIASDDWSIAYTATKDQGKNWKANVRYQTGMGAKAKQFVDSLKMTGLANRLWKLYAIRQFSLAVNSISETPDCNLPDSSKQAGNLVAQLIALPNEDSLPEKNWASDFARCVGRGWGPITAQHMLTDLGLSIKPDIHLCRAVVKLGWLESASNGRYHALMSDKEIGPITPELAGLVTNSIIAMTERIASETNQSIRKARRELDFVLMEWNRTFKNGT